MRPCRTAPAAADAQVTTCARLKRPITPGAAAAAAAVATAAGAADAAAAAVPVPVASAAGAGGKGYWTRGGAG
eukprot:1144247-Pelagomonas_calceolata.AAC.4